jgi:hypothetical protein
LLIITNRDRAQVFPTYEVFSRMQLFTICISMRNEMIALKGGIKDKDKKEEREILWKGGSKTKTKRRKGKFYETTMKRLALCLELQSRSIIFIVLSSLFLEVPFSLLQTLPWSCKYQCTIKKLLKVASGLMYFVVYLLVNIIQIHYYVSNNYLWKERYFFLLFFKFNFYYRFLITAE